MSPPKTLFVPIARVLKERGFPKNNQKQYKIELFNKGSVLLKTLSRLAIETKDKGFVELRLRSQSKALGGKWGQAKDVAIFVDENVDLKHNEFLFAAREDFPALNSEKELYLCDVLGFEVCDEEGLSFGTVSGFDLSLGVLIEVKAQEAFSFPFEWVSDVDWKGRRLLVPEVSQWVGLKEEKGEREED